jgi:hypothetical protein
MLTIQSQGYHSKVTSYGNRLTSFTVSFSHIAGYRNS